MQRASIKVEEKVVYKRNAGLPNDCFNSLRKKIYKRLSEHDSLSLYSTVCMQHITVISVH